MKLPNKPFPCQPTCQGLPINNRNHISNSSTPGGRVALGPGSLHRGYFEG